MIFDLSTNEKMDAVVGILYSAVKENHQRLKLICEGMTQEELEYRGPYNNLNSTSQLIRHLTYVDSKWVYRIKDEPFPSSLEKRYGPALDAKGKLPLIKGVSLNTLISDYDDVIEMLKNSCTHLTDEDLNKKVLFGHHSDKQATIRWGIWHIADHSRYHQANINLLRKWYGH